MHDELRAQNWVWACSLADLDGSGCSAVQIASRGTRYLLHEGKVALSTIGALTWAFRFTEEQSGTTL